MFVSRRRRRIAWDDRDEFKVRADTLYADGALPDVYTRDPDPESGNFGRDTTTTSQGNLPSYIDGIFYKPVRAPRHNIPVSVEVGWIANANDLGALRLSPPSLGLQLADGFTTVPVDTGDVISVPSYSLDFSDADNSQYIVLVMA